MGGKSKFRPLPASRGGNWNAKIPERFGSEKVKQTNWDNKRLKQPLRGGQNFLTPISRQAFINITARVFQRIHPPTQRGMRAQTEEHMPESKFNKIDLEIVRMLQTGRRPYKEIGLELGLSEATIRSRVNRLIDQGLVEIRAMISTKDMGAGYFTAYIGVCLKSPALKKTAEQIADLPGVISVAVVTGRYDLILTVMLTPDLGLMDFFNIMLEKYSDSISANETFMIYESVNLKTPYPF